MTANVLITESAIEAMYAEGVKHPEIETAFDLAGFIDPQGTAIVTTVIPPAPADIVRGIAHVKLGGEFQGLAIKWLSANAKLMKKCGIIAQDLSFSYLHSGHSHHQLGYKHYSGTDENTIVKMVEEIGLPVAVGPLLNLDPIGPTAKWQNTYSGEPSLLIVKGNRLYIKFYYFSRAMSEEGKRKPIVVIPKIIKDKEAPPMPPLSWRYLTPKVFAEQLRHLESRGCQIQVVERDIQDGPPMETQFLLSHPRWKSSILIVTPWNFPTTAPIFKLLKEGKQETATGIEWNPEMDLIDAILRLEEKGEL